MDSSSPLEESTYQVLEDSVEYSLAGSSTYGGTTTAEKVDDLVRQQVDSSTTSSYSVSTVPPYRDVGPNLATTEKVWTCPPNSIRTPILSLSPNDFRPFGIRPAIRTVVALSGEFFKRRKGGDDVAKLWSKGTSEASRVEGNGKSLNKLLQRQEDVVGLQSRIREQEPMNINLWFCFVIYRRIHFMATEKFATTKRVRGETASAKSSGGVPIVTTDFYGDVPILCLLGFFLELYAFKIVQRAAAAFLRPEETPLLAIERQK